RASGGVVIDLDRGLEARQGVLEQGVLFDVGQDGVVGGAELVSGREGRVAPERAEVAVPWDERVGVRGGRGVERRRIATAVGVVPVGRFEVGDAEADLFEVVRGLQAGGGGADFLDGGQQQADEDGYDGNDDQQFDQGERGTAAHGGALLWEVS